MTSIGDMGEAYDMMNAMERMDRGTNLHFSTSFKNLKISAKPRTLIGKGGVR